MNTRGTLLPSQMALLLIAVSSGSAIVYIPNPVVAAAENAAWISLLLAYAYGTLILGGVLYLHHRHNGLSMIEYTRQLAGPAAAVVIAVMLAGLLTFAIPAIVAGIGDFFTSTMMRETPLYVFNALTLATAAFTVRSGVVAMARMFSILVYGILGLSVAIFTLAIPNYRPEYLLPVLPHGIPPVLHGAFITAGFPFGEIVFLAMLLPYARQDNPSPFNKAMMAAFAVTAITLVLSAVTTVLAFGPAGGLYRYSLFMLARNILFGDTIERIELIAGITLMVSSYMKATIFLFMMNQVLTQMCNLKDDGALVYPLSALFTFLSLIMFDNPADNMEQVYVIWPFLVIVFSGLSVLSLTVLTWMKKGAKRA